MKRKVTFNTTDVTKEDFEKIKDLILKTRGVPENKGVCKYCGASHG